MTDIVLAIVLKNKGKQKIIHALYMSSLHLLTLQVASFFLDHTWEYSAHHIHPGDFENLTESHFTELQSVQPVHPSSVHRFTDVEPSHFLEPSLTGHHLTLPSPQVRVLNSQLVYC